MQLHLDHFRCRAHISMRHPVLARCWSTFRDALVVWRRIEGHRKVPAQGVEDTLSALPREQSRVSMVSHACANSVGTIQTVSLGGGKMVHRSAAPKVARLLKAGRLCICVQCHSVLDAVEHTQQAPEELTDEVSVPVTASASSHEQPAGTYD